MPRPALRRVVGLVVALACALGATALWFATRAPAPLHIDLYLDGIAVDHTGAVVTVPAHQPVDVVEGTIVLTPGPDASVGARVAAESLAREQLDWLAAGTLPGAGTSHEGMARRALLEVRALIRADGALVAAAHPRWAYAWPRDNSFGAAALAWSDHQDDAVRVLDFLARVQGDNGTFEARYLIDGSGSPDERASQTDGTGWVLWSLGQVADAATSARERGAPTPRRSAAEVAGRFRPMLDRSTDRILTLIDRPSGLPPASPDYWEVHEDALTLGTAAPLLAGLEAAGRLYAAIGEPQQAARADAGARRLRVAIERTFGAQGYPRSIRGGASDAATTFALPPFVSPALDGAVAAWEDSVEAMLRPAGGLSPGGSWREDGISWTPETALYALAAAHQDDPGGAERWLAWLSEHRTATGSLPEKVLAGGEPAAVAPLAWTNATVLLTLARLEAG